MRRLLQPPQRVAPDAPADSIPALAEEADGTGVLAASDFGSFAVQGLDGSEHTQDVFSEHELTLVYIMSTWDSQSAEALPALTDLSTSSLPEKDVGVEAALSDTWKDGEENSEALEAACEIRDAAGVAFPTLVSSVAAVQKVVDGVGTLPTALFVGRDGRAVAMAEGARTDPDEWMILVDKALSIVRDAG